MELLRGVVEDNKDPLKQSRVRVRIFGQCTKDNEFTQKTDTFSTVKSSELPWLEVIGDTSFGLIGGVGLSSTLKQGTWVYLVGNHDDPNKMLVIGVITGISKLRPKYKDGEGFNDVDGIFPFDSRTDETDNNRLSTGENLDSEHYDVNTSVHNNKNTIHKKINDTLDSVTAVDGVSGASVSQTEPLSTNNLTEYPHCSVLETESGHVIEYDDTKNNERIRLYHTSGSYFEMKPDGSIVQKSVSGTNHFIAVGDIQEHVALGVKRYIEQNLEEIIQMSVKRNIKENLREHINGNLDLTVDGNLTWNIGGNVMINAANVATSGDVTANGVSLINHVHSGVQAGGATTTPPV